MVYILTALPCEAKALIDMFCLKREDGDSSDIFKNNEYFLAVSKPGKIRIAAAVGFLAGRSRPCNSDVIINVGVCGSADKTIKSGTVFLCNKIVDYDTKKEFYPDILIRHSFLESAIATYSRHILIDDEIILPLADMEASGFIESASLFFKAHNIYCLKIISDHLESKRIDTSLITHLVEQNGVSIKCFIESIRKFALDSSVCKHSLDESDRHMLGILADKLRLTFSQKVMLEKSALAYRAYNATNDDQRSIKTMFSDILRGRQVTTKKEGKELFEQVVQILDRR